MAGRSDTHRRPDGGLVDRSRPLSFTFDGQSYTGLAGDTLASALIANGVRLVGRSFKYHRPRGILSAGVEEPNALVELRQGARREPNTRATGVELYDGLVAASQNRWPSLRFDAMAVNQLLAPVFGAGFYYKTFMWPAPFWEKVYEPLIRRAAGLGRAADQHDPDRYEKATLHCDVLVIGAGPAGLMAALAAGRSGARVVLAEDDTLVGGRLNAETTAVDGEPAAAFAARMAAELAAMPEVTLLTRTTVFGVYDHGAYGAVERLADHRPTPPEHGARQKLWRIVARRAVLCAGAIERPLVFGDNDRPGVMLAGAVRTYVNRFAALPGHRAVVVANNDDAARTVADLTAAGVSVQALVDSRPEVSEPVRAAANAAGAWLLTGSVPLQAHGRAGVQGLEIEGPRGARLSLDCDLVAMSGGWSPAVHLTSHLGGKPVWDDAKLAFLPGALPPGMAVAGSAAGAFSLDECLTTGTWAGIEAARAAGFEPPAVEVPRAERDSAAVAPLWRSPKAGGKAFVDFQNDVTTSDIELSEREAFRSVEHMKRYTTLGMATDQGKTSNVNAMALMAELTGKPLGATGTTTFRPPYAPVAIGALAGHHRGKAFRPTRLTAAHGWAQEQGAVFIETGVWLRAGWFPKPGEDWLAACTREVKATRSAVGICDVSTLGKIDIQGPDAAKFLDRVYVNTMSTVPVGKCRYGLMLREDGFVFDDGTIARLGENHYLMTTTTAKAGEVMAHLELCLQWLWPDLDVQAGSVTEQWTQFAVAGPNSRALLQRVLEPGQDLSNEAFPYLACAPVMLRGGVPGRLFRLSFSGELAYELGVPASCGDALPRALMEAGADLGVTPYGLEAMSVMRIEKGHVAGGELNGQTTAADLGLGKMVSQKKDCIGRVMATRPALVDPDRETLVGFKVLDPVQRVGAGSHFLDIGKEPTLANDLGHVTATAFSPFENGWIGLGLMRRGPQRIGEKVRCWDGVRGRDVVVELRHPCFFDPQGERLRG
ncbi:sarcosine oxidase subunit alpha family protein [Alsobacter sp. R-9]